MILNNAKKEYVEFCTEEILREIVRSKRRYFEKENQCKWECTLNECGAADVWVEKIELIMGDNDVKIDEFLSLKDSIENRKIFNSMKLLSEKEMKVVSLRIEEDLPIRQINLILGTNRKSGTSDVLRRAMNKIRKNMESQKGDE